jgi:hypothetical protein
MNNKEYHKFEEQGITIETDVTYQKAGTNWYNGERERGGYYLHISPVEIGDLFVSRTLGSGFKYMLLEVDRQSSKRLEKAKRLATEERDQLIAIAVNEQLRKN